VATAFGNSRMGILRGPGQFNTDLSLIKLFPLGSNERRNVEFRTEFFNAFNQPTSVIRTITLRMAPASAKSSVQLPTRE
jgi:hypothetical protein